MRRAEKVEETARSRGCEGSQALPTDGTKTLVSAPLPLSQGQRGGCHIARRQKGRREEP